MWELANKRFENLRRKGTVSIDSTEDGIEMITDEIVMLMLGTK